MRITKSNVRMWLVIVWALGIIPVLSSCGGRFQNTAGGETVSGEAVSGEASNPYFCINGDDEVSFKGVAWFSSFGDIPIPKYKTKIHFTEIAKLKRGILYQLKVDQMTDNEIPEERLSLGYFYVQEDKIIRIWDNDDYDAEGNVWDISQEALKDLVDNDVIPKDSAVVCQENEIKDTLDEGELGWHQYLKADGARRRYGGFYQHPQHSGYWETFIWEKGTGLVCYQSGYRDGVDYIELTERIEYEKDN